MNSGQVTIDAVRGEARSAESKYGSFRSTHEGYGVLSEEVYELLDAIKRNSRLDIYAEAIQVAAVAVRLAKTVHDFEDEFARRSGLME